MSPRLICGHLQAATTADGAAAGTTCAITLAQRSNPQLLELCRPGRRLRLVLAGDEHTALKLAIVELPEYNHEHEGRQHKPDWAEDPDKQRPGRKETSEARGPAA
eukprot:CAMPEP_0181222224 /NCGR_PEP_ID=MMETSP1096-20121128/29845_1 /TAXON_ID=156174 ORGANISM="Chrysochromulina ericina, Strain CCMP281" /NCGR_SAMPLE_ID=MMETSP1096 /ASSEMBLY_ACC=CAM_ASM_000453 /LENGTH=104 /DNA_ID=CAMNT_0023314957 /DNA_START=400 /DNA_END=711 /DNA_ORIENTATION=+